MQAARSLLLQGSWQAGLEALKRMPLVTYGQPGAADIQGIVKHQGEVTVGRFLAIEVKRPGESPTPEQERWGQMVVNMGGLYILATSVEDVRRTLESEGYLG